MKLFGSIQVKVNLKHFSESVSLQVESGKRLDVHFICSSLEVNLCVCVRVFSAVRRMRVAFFEGCVLSLGGLMRHTASRFLSAG